MCPHDTETLRRLSAALAYVDEWYDWQPRPEKSADYEEPEAGW